MTNRKRFYNVVLKAQLAGARCTEAGKSGASVDKVAQGCLPQMQVTESILDMDWDGSVGLFIHENPRLSPSDDTILRGGHMIETVEPGIYVPGFGGVRIEDMVVVTKEGHINLAHSPKELIELPVENRTYTEEIIMLKQLSIFAENVKGAMHKMTQILQENDINILGSVTNGAVLEHRIVRMVVSDPDKAGQRCCSRKGRK